MEKAVLAVRRASYRIPFSIPPLEGTALLILIAVWLFGA